MKLVNVRGELSIPSWYSAILLLFTVILTATIAFAKRMSVGLCYLRHWAVISPIFLYLSGDEMLRLHERMSSVVVQPALDSLGFEPAGVLSYRGSSSMRLSWSLLLWRTSSSG